MKKTMHGLMLFVCLSIFSVAANAALVNGRVLSIETGSQFGFEVSPGVFAYTPITGVDGIHLGTAQPPGPLPVPGTGGSIDYYNSSGLTGRDYTVSPTNVLNTTANTASIDFSGWTMVIDTLGTFDMGSGGVASVSCAVDCNVGDSYTLAYAAIVPAGHPSGFGGVAYSLSLSGHVVPVPGAFWLFASGLLAMPALVVKKNTISKVKGKN